MNPGLTRTLFGSWIVFGVLGVACGKDESLGDDRDDALPAAGHAGREASSSGGAGDSSTGGAS